MLDRIASRWRELGSVELPAPPAPGSVALEASGVSVLRGGREVVSDVDLVVRHGELVVMVGPNGAGKSTLMGVLAADLEPASGAVSLDGRLLAGWGVRELAMRRAMLLQRIEISFPFSVLDVVRMGRSPWAGTSAEEEDDQAIAGAMADTDVTDLRDREYPSLSGGERARAALARVLAQGTGILLLDEPTAALDLRYQIEILTLLRALNEERGTTIVVSTHDLNFAAALCHRVVLLKQGRVLAQGPTAETLTGTNVGALYEVDADVQFHPRAGHLTVVPLASRH